MVESRCGIVYMLISLLRFCVTKWLGDESMIFTHYESNRIYQGIFSWLSGHTPGSRCNISLLKGYYKDIWEPIERKILLLQNKDVLDDEEQE